MLKVGVGLRDRSDDDVEEKAAIARAMREEGKTLQEIAERWGIRACRVYLPCLVKCSFSFFPKPYVLKEKK